MSPRTTKKAAQVKPTAPNEHAVEIAKEMRKLGFPCSARQVRKIAAHDDWENSTPMPENAALASNILAALEARK